MTITITSAGGVTNNGPYSTLAAYATDLNAASLSGNHVAEVSGTISDTSRVTLSGWTANGFSVTLQNATGEGPEAGERLWWLTSGRAILTNSVVGDLAYAFAGVNLTVRGLQIETSADASHGIQPGSTTVVVDGCVIRHSGNTGYAVDFASAGGIVRKSLILSQVSGVRYGGGNNTWVDRCTVVSLSGSGTGINSLYGSLGARGTAVYGFATLMAGTALSGTTHNAISGSTWGGSGWTTSGQTGLVSGDFVNTGSGTEDYAAASGSTRLVNTGTSVTGVSTDIYGVAVPQGGTEDIGATEYASAGASVSGKYRSLLGAG